MSTLPLKTAKHEGSGIRQHDSGSGTSVFFSKAFKFLARSFLFTNSAVWYEADLTNTIHLHNPKIDISVESVAIKEFERWATTFFYPRGDTGSKLIKEMNTAKKNGHIFLCAKREGDLAGYLKIGVIQVYIHDYRAPIDAPTHTAIIYDTFVLDGFRRLGIAASLISQGMRLMSQRGYTCIRCHIPSWNTASIRAYAKCGFQPIKEVRFYRIIGYSFFSSDPSFPSS